MLVSSVLTEQERERIRAIPTYRPIMKDFHPRTVDNRLRRLGLVTIFDAKVRLTVAGRVVKRLLWEIPNPQHDTKKKGRT